MVHIKTLPEGAWRRSGSGRARDDERLLAVAGDRLRLNRLGGFGGCLEGGILGRQFLNPAP